MKKNSTWLWALLAVAGYFLFFRRTANGAPVTGNPGGTPGGGSGSGSAASGGIGLGSLLGLLHPAGSALNGSGGGSGGWSGSGVKAGLNMTGSLNDLFSGVGSTVRGWFSSTPPNYTAAQSQAALDWLPGSTPSASLTPLSLSSGYTAPTFDNTSLSYGNMTTSNDVSNSFYGGYNNFYNPTSYYPPVDTTTYTPSTDYTYTPSTDYTYTPDFSSFDTGFWY